MKKSYKLEAVIDGRFEAFNREFDSRNSAMNYLFKYYNRHCLTNPVVVDEYSFDGNKHDIEYLMDYYNRFRIIRVIR